MRRFLLSILALSIAITASAQPKMVINIVVGGMRATDLERYSANLSAEGLMRLKRGGVNFTECYTDFVPTSEQMALTTIATGALPSMHGVSSIRWYDRTSGNKVVRLCVDAKGNYTTDHFTATTLAQALRTADSNARTVTIAHNATSAMVLCGDGGECYWIDSLGNWNSAHCYTKQLPDWVNSHNEIGFNRIQVSGTWFGKLTKGKYLNSRATDIHIYDIYAKPKGSSSKKLTDNWLDELLHTPAGNYALFDFASKALDNMVNDKQSSGIKMLNICLDTPRNIAQKYGPDSVEYEDMLYRLDAAIVDFLKIIDVCFPKKSDYLITLTADHGMGHSATEESSQRQFNASQSEVILNAFLSAQYGQGNWVLSCDKGAIYLNRDLIYAKKLSTAQVQNEAATFAMQFRGVAIATTATAMQGGAMSNRNSRLLQNSFYPRRSGDILYCLQPGWSELSRGKVAQSGSPYNYDRHIPLIFYGANCGNGNIERQVSSTSIAVTIASLLGIVRPDCADGEVIYELKKQ
ncbi:MAG: alkaline phosphatase family protein [Alistipes sp.]|nr:alkaline phosphatase family protein [Alistipes sp.]